MHCLTLSQTSGDATNFEDRRPLPLDKCAQLRHLTLRSSTSGMLIIDDFLRRALAVLGDVDMHSAPLEIVDILVFTFALHRRRSGRRRRRRWFRNATHLRPYALKDVGGQRVDSIFVGFDKIWRKSRVALKYLFPDAFGADETQIRSGIQQNVSNYRLEKLQIVVGHLEVKR